MGRTEIVLVAAAATCGLSAHYLIPRFPPVAAEAILLAALFYVLLASRPGLAAVRSLAVRQRLVTAALVAAVLAGHFHAKVYNTFPFVDWDIYAHVLRGKPRFFEYYATRPDGTEARVIPAELVPALRKKLAVQLEELAFAIEAASDRRRRDDLVQWQEGLLLAMARAYNRQHVGSPLVAIRIETCTVTLEESSGRDSVTCVPYRVWTWADGRE